MNQSLTKFKELFLEEMLQLLWKTWSELGVSGMASPKFSQVIDLEPLILTTCFWGKYDQRLFDEALSWMIKNERFISVQRLQTIIRKESFHATGLLGPISQKLMQNNPTPKWRGLNKKMKENLTEQQTPVELFLTFNNRALPVIGANDKEFLQFNYIRLPFIDRHLSRIFSPGKISSLQLQLRALFGLNSRAETMLALLLDNQVSIKEVAETSYFSWRSIQEVLFELSHSGLVTHPAAKRKRKYQLTSNNWHEMFLGKNASIKPDRINWTKLYLALELLWNKLNDESFLKLSFAGKNIEMTELLKTKINPLLAQTNKQFQTTNTEIHTDFLFENLFENTLDILNKL